MAMTDALCAAVADGNAELVKGFLRRGADVNFRSSDGFLPLCLAAFWGHSEIVKFLLKNGADVNGRNSGTKWTACHCAAFQGHGKVVMILLEHKANVQLTDEHGRSPIDFASALDSIWPHFAALGFQRTSKQVLIQLKIIEKVKGRKDDAVAQGSYLSRPGSAYMISSQGINRQRQYQPRVDMNIDMGMGTHALTDKQNIALSNGDVLTDLPSESPTGTSQNPRFSAWRS